MLRLYQNSSINKQMINDLDYIGPLISVRTLQSLIAPRLVNLGFIELCQHICQKARRKNLFDKTVQSIETTVMLSSLNCAVNLTDISDESCYRVIEIGLHEDIFSFLNTDLMDPSKVELSSTQSDFADAAMSVAYNVIQASQLFVFLPRDAL